MIPVRNDILNVLSRSLVVSAIYEYKPRFMHIYPPKHPSIPASNIYFDSDLVCANANIDYQRLKFVWSV